MKIHRSTSIEDGIALPTATLRDERLSFAARGLLCELLTRPNGWETTADELSQQAREARGAVANEGRRAIRAAFAELESLGYMVRRTARHTNGRFVTTLEVYDTPGHHSPQPRLSATTAEPHPRGEVLYRHWDGDDRLLYVGVTRNFNTRQHAHSVASRWMEFKVRTTHEQYPSRATVEAAEAAAVRDEQPLFNVAGNDDPDAHQRLRAYLAERNRMDLFTAMITPGAA